MEWIEYGTISLLVNPLSNSLLFLLK